MPENFYQNNKIRFIIESKDLLILQAINNGWVNNEDLSQIVDLATNTISDRINKLEKLELVQRVNGGRYTTYNLTPTGQKIVSDCLVQINIAFLSNLKFFGVLDSELAEVV